MPKRGASIYLTMLLCPRQSERCVKARASRLRALGHAGWNTSEAALFFVTKRYRRRGTVLQSLLTTMTVYAQH